MDGISRSIVMVCSMPWVQIRGFVFATHERYRGPPNSESEENARSHMFIYIEKNNSTCEWRQHSTVCEVPFSLFCWSVGDCRIDGPHGVFDAISNVKATAILKPHDPCPTGRYDEMISLPLVARGRIGPGTNRAE